MRNIMEAFATWGVLHDVMFLPSLLPDLEKSSPEKGILPSFKDPIKNSCISLFHLFCKCLLASP